MVWKISFLLLVIIGTCSNYVWAKSQTPSERIIGGAEQTIKAVPYLVSIRYKKTNESDFEHRCAGVIYSPNVILTTATCVIGTDIWRLQIKAGSSYRTETDGLLYLVEKYEIHPDYNIWFYENDLALLKLAFDLTNDLPKEIKPIELANSVPDVNSSALIAGWGIVNPGDNLQFADCLKVAEVQLVSQNVCKQAYGEGRISDSMLCAGADGSVDACIGDAGGPLVLADKIIGLVSWGSGCAQVKYPGVYTNLVYFKEWINAETSKL